MGSDGRITTLITPRTIQPFKPRRLAPDDAAALRNLFRGRDRLILDGEPATTWQFEPVQLASLSGVILHGAREDVALCITDDGLCEPLGERAWSDYGADSQPLAWLLGHHILIESLNRLVGEPLLPRSRADSGRPAGISLSITLGFSVTAQDGRVTRGTLGLSPATTARLAAHPGWQPQTDSFVPWLALPTQLRVGLRCTSFPVSELRATQTGDVLVLGRRAQCWYNLYLTRLGARANGQPDGWRAGYDGTRLVAIGPVYEAERTMTETQSDPAGETLSSDVVARTPITLEFELGSLTLPLGEVAGLKPGFVFQLPGRLEDARVVIRAGGRRIGRGELVAVGDVLGVQVMTLETDGFQ